MFEFDCPTSNGAVKHLRASVMLLLTLVWLTALFIVMQPSHAQEGPCQLQGVFVSYPTKLRPGQSAQIGVTFTVTWRGDSAQYFITRVTVYESSGNQRDFQTVFMGGGSYNQQTLTATTTSNMSAPNKSMNWILMVEVRCVENGMTGRTLAEEDRTLTILVTDRALVTIATGVPGMPIVFDGLGMIANAAGQLVINTTIGSHSFQLQNTLMISQVERYIFNAWSDGKTTVGRTENIQDDTVFQALYSHQYYLKVNSQYGTTIGTNWYNEGTVAVFSVNPTAVQTGGRTFVFAGWQGSVNQTSPSASVLMNGPKVVTALWALQGSTSASASSAATTTSFTTTTGLRVQPIPGFPVESIIAGVALAFLALGTQRKRRQTR